ncbi:MAG: hypothetical protein M3362_27580 [Acidobacteriota bacterium]|nr:hypothetical protein [Acidobacteriota bacterium]
MARLRRSSHVLETARQRLAGLKSIQPAPDFGPNLSLADYEQKIEDLSDDLDGYNAQLAALDERQNTIEAKEDALNDWNKRMLAATGAQYGSNSSEYEMAGGTRSSERARTTRKGPGKPGPNN